MRELSDADVGIDGGARELTDAEVFGQAGGRDVGVLESAGRGAMQRGAQVSRTAGQVLSAPAVVFDAVRSALSGRTHTGAQDWAFRNFVDPSQAAVENWEIKPGERQTMAGKVAGATGGMAIDLPIMFASGGGTAIPRAANTVREILTPVLQSTARTMAVPATVSGADTAQRLQERGVDPTTATAAALNTSMNTIASGVLPLNAPGNLASRIAQGAVSGPVQGQTERVLENAILGDRYAAQQRPFSWDEVAVQAAPSALMAGVMGPRPAARAPSRADLGYFPLEPVGAGPARANVEAIIPPDAPPASAERADTASRVKDRRSAFRDAADEGVVYRRADMQDGQLAEGARPVETARGTVPTGPEDLAALRQGERVLAERALRAAERRIQGLPDVIPVDQAGRADAGDQRTPGIKASMLDQGGQQARAEADARRAFDVAEAQRQRKQAGQDEASLQGQPRDLREARAGGTTTPEGTAATAPQRFTFYRAKVENGQMVSGDRVEVVGEPFSTPNVKDEKGRPVELQTVRFLDREGQPESPVPVRDLSAAERPANPRFAQDIAATSYAPPKGVGAGEGQPQPRRAGQRITTERSPEFIPNENASRAQQEPSRSASRTPNTYDQAEVMADRALKAPPPAVPAALPAPRQSAVEVNARGEAVLPADRQVLGRQEPPRDVNFEPTNRPAAAPQEPPPSSYAPQPRAEPASPPAEGPKVPPKPKATSLLGAIIKAGGLNPREMRDLTGEGRTGVEGVPVGLFKKPGASRDGGVKDRGFGLDEMVVRLRQEGFHIPDDPVDGGVQTLRDMIRNEVSGERTYGDGGDAMREYDIAKRMQQEDDYHAYKMESDPEYRADYERQVEAARAAEFQKAAEWQGAGKDAGADAEAVARASEIDPDRVESAAMRYENDDAAFMAEVRRILDGNADRKQADTGATADGRGADGKAPDRGAGGQGEGQAAGEVRAEDRQARPDFGLEQPTESGLRARAAGDERARAERARVEDAPRPEDFTLSGSDRAADEAAARGQQDLLSQDRVERNTAKVMERAAAEERAASGGAKLYGGLPLDAMAKHAQEAFGWAGREAKQWAEAGAAFAKSMSDLDIPGAARRFGEWALDSATGAVRSDVKRGGNSKTANWVLDQFADKAGDLGQARGETYSASVDAYTRRQVNAVMRAIGDMKPEEMKQVVALVRNPDGIRTGTRIGDAAAAIRKELDGALKYMREAGVDVGEVKKGYYPREFDLDRVTKDPEAFLRGAEQAYRETGMGQRDAAEAAKELHNRLMFGETGSVFQPDKGNPRANFLKGRNFGKQVDDPKHPLNRFLTDDPVWSLTRYFERAAKRAELARRFGDKWEKWPEIEKRIIDEGGGESLQPLKDYIELAAGLRGPKPGAGLSAASWARTWGALMFLEKATLSSLSEFIVPAIRAGNPLEMGRSLKTTIGALLKDGKSKELAALGEDLGILSRGMMESLHAQRFAGGETVTEAQRKVLDAFFKRTGLSAWTEATRVGSIDVGRTFIRRIAKETADGSKLSASYLGELGIPAERAKAFADWLAKTNDGLPTAADLKGPEADLYGVALRRFVKQSIMDPSAITRPKWASSPFGSVIAQLQSFNYAFYENVWKRNARLLGEAWKNDGGYSHYERARMAAPMAMMPLLAGAAYAIGEARDALLGDPTRRDEEEGWQKAIKAASRGAPMAPIDPLLNYVSSARYRRSAAESFAGPVLGKVASGLDAARDLVANNSDSTNTQERKVAGAVWDLIVEPSANLILAATPATKLGTAVAAAGTQAAGAGGVKEQFVSSVAGEKKQAGRGTGRKAEIRLP